jgi:hypothetical protein
LYFNSAATARQKGYRVMAHGAASMSPRWQTFGFVTGAGEVGSSTGRLKSAFNWSMLMCQRACDIETPAAIGLWLVRIEASAPPRRLA